MARLAGTRELRREIDHAVARGRAYDEINREIVRPCVLAASARAALWLYMLSRLEDRRRSPRLAAPGHRRAADVR